MGRFCQTLLSGFAPSIEVQPLVREIQKLQQITKTTAEITAKFQERALLIPQYAVDEDVRRKFHVEG